MTTDNISQAPSCLRIIISASSSGGHVIPALVVAEALKRQGYEVIFVGTFKSFRQRIKDRGYEVFEFNGCGFVGSSPIQKSKFFKDLLANVWSVRRLFKKLRPAAVIGFGGYGMCPVVLGARWSNIPIILHEQNVKPGKANQWLALLAEKIAVSNESSRKFFNQKKTVVTGCPININNEEAKSIDKAEIYQRWNFNKNKKTLLVIGGSQGSYAINQAICDILKNPLYLIDFQVIHITGAKDYSFVRSAYENRKVDVWVTPFLECMEEAYAISDLAITRAGSLTLHELSYAAIPSIIIPYPHAYGHQKDNIRMLPEQFSFIHLDEEYLNAGQLWMALQELLILPPSQKDQTKDTSKPTTALVDVLETVLA